MAALKQIAHLASGCHQNCEVPVVCRTNAIAYASTTAVYMHTPTPHTVAATGPRSNMAPGSTSPTSADGKVITTYPLTRVFASGVSGLIQSFDFNDAFMACVTKHATTTVWRLANAEVLNGKQVPSGIDQFFKRNGGPSVVRVAGKYHVLYGTTTGWLVSANLSDGSTVHELKLSIDGDASNRNKTNSSGVDGGGGGGGGGSRINVGHVTCIDVSLSRPDTIVAGTSEGAMFIISLHPTNGLRQNLALRPFAVSSSSSSTAAAAAAAAAAVEKSLAAVTVVAFDPNNANYVAVGSRDGTLVLFDIASNAIVQTFEVHNTPVVSISWLAGHAGTFVTADGESGRLHVWTVNSRTPSLVWNPIHGSVILCAAPFAQGCLFLALRNGSVAVYNTKTHQVEMQTEAGHTDALHACRYAHHDRDLIASASTDGSVRVWNTKQLVLQRTIGVGCVIAYSVDWSPSGKYLVVALGNGEVVCYHVGTQRENWRVSVSCGEKVHCVSWSHAESGSYIAASHSVGVTVLSSRDGKIVRRYKTNTRVLGVEFDPKHAKHLAVGCHDGQVLVYHVSSSREAPSVVLAGHTDAVGSVTYNPTVSNFLLSCSDDTTLRVWDVSSMTSHTASVTSRVLRGHTGRVNAIAWCSLTPYIALSGSSDCTVRVWDVRKGTNVTTIRVHNAEVLSLSGHPGRPLVFASVSRDSTIVFWYLEMLRHLCLDAALGTLDRCIVSDKNALMTISAATPISVVAADAALQLTKDLKDPGLTPAKRMELLVDFFEFPYGAADVARAAWFRNDSQDTSNLDCAVVPVSRLAEVCEKRGKALVEKARGKTVSVAGEEYKKTRVIEAAEAMLQFGKVSEYCQLMVEAGEWDSAIAAAPVISRDFWRSLCLQAAEAMEASGDTRAVRYFIMAEESSRAARCLARQSSKNWDAATVIAQTCPQRVEHGTSTEPPHNTTVDTNGTSAVVMELLEGRTAALAHTCNPRIVAAAKLFDGLNDDAVMQLIYSGDVSMAHLLIHTVPLQQQVTIDAGYRLSMLQSCCQSMWDTALLCATRQSNPYDGLATVLAFYQQTLVMSTASDGGSSSNPSTTSPTADNLKSFHEHILAECRRLQLPLDMDSIQRTHASDGLASINQLAAMTLSPNAPIGAVTREEVLQTMSNFVDNILQVALQDIDSPNAVFYLKQAFAVSCYVSLPIQTTPKSAPPAPQPPQPPQQQQQQQPAAAATVEATGGSTAFVGTTTHSASVRKFLAQVFLLATLMCVKVYRFPKLLNSAFSKTRELAEGDSSVMSLLVKAQPALSSYSPHSIEVDCAMFGTSLPAFSVEGGVQVKSVLTTEPVAGAAHLLEDGTSVIARTEALQWMLCCAFSPLASGARLFPL